MAVVKKNHGIPVPLFPSTISSRNEEPIGIMCESRIASPMPLVNVHSINSEIIRTENEFTFGRDVYIATPDTQTGGVRLYDATNEIRNHLSGQSRENEKSKTHKEICTLLYESDTQGLWRKNEVIIKRFLLGAAGIAIATTIIMMTPVLFITDPDPVSSWFVKRTVWAINRPRRCTLAPLNITIKLIVIEHTEGVPCVDDNDCINKVRDAQADHITNGYCDVKYNFLVGGDGRVYEGRGFNKLENEVGRYVNKTLNVAFIGNYNNDHCTEEQFGHLKRFMEKEIKWYNLAPDFKVVGAYQVKNRPTSPGRSIIEKLQTWERWIENPDMYEIL